MFRYSIIFIWFVLSGSVFGNTLTVCPNCEIKTIKEAIEQAEPFDTIRVQKDVYKEHEIIIDKPLTLIGIDYPTIDGEDRKSTRLNSSHVAISYAVFCLKKKHETTEH